MAALDLRQYVPGLPPRITREYLDSLTPEEQAALLRKFESGARKIREEQIRAEAAAQQRAEEAERIRREVEEEFGVSTPEEVEALADEAAARCEALWLEVEALADAGA